MYGYKFSMLYIMDTTNYNEWPQKIVTFPVDLGP